MDYARIATILENESRIFSFPVFDFNGVASGLGLTRAGSPLKILADGQFWAVGISASYCTPAAGGLASASSITYNIWDASQAKYWFTGGILIGDVGVPLECKAGKAGNPHYFPAPQKLTPGVQLVLAAAQQSGGTPTGRSPLYVAIHCVLEKNLI